jgi:glycosyltransferase involved in cell wall biosynthesis
MKSVSVVLCVRNGADVLPNMVHSVFKAAASTPGSEVELLIVDNGSTDSTVATAESLGLDAPIPVQVVLEPVKGVCRAKNRGIRLAKGEIVAFTDDDCTWSTDYLSDLLRHYESDVGPVIRGGRVELGDPTDLPFTIKVEDEPGVYGGIAHPGGFVHGCNLTIPREVIDKIGGFDERFGPGAPFKAAEETELIYRAHKAGIPVHYVPDMAVYHFHGRKDQPDIKNLNESYQLGNGALHAKHGLTDRVLLRHFYWNTRNYLKEWFGGPKFNAFLGLSHRDLIFPQLLGMARFMGRRRSTVKPIELGSRRNSSS